MRIQLIVFHSILEAQTCQIIIKFFMKYVTDISFATHVLQKQLARYSMNTGII